ncbi:MAG TPA: glycosyltransferase family 39 protein [Flavipsychrobacter sp.]|nr:glycosyltransferase family 39 protein [Flavipsychrobacter sp.]
MKNPFGKKFVSIALITVLLLGLFIRFYQYFSGRNLWEDEAHLALNFMHLGYRDLTKPLENFQSAPIFFLFSVETFSKIFGFSAIALRAFPFLVSICTFPIFYFLVLDLTKDKLAALIAFFIFAVNTSFIYYSSELKPYTVDVCVYIWIFYLAVSSFPFIEKNRYKLLGIAGVLAILYSNAATVVLACAVIYITKDNLKVFLSKTEEGILEVKTKVRYLLVLCSWGIVFLSNYFLFIFRHPYAEGMKKEWAFTFPPINIFSKEFAAFILKTIQETFFDELLFINKNYGFSYLLLIIIVTALVYLIYKKKGTVLLFTVAPIVIHFLLSMMKLYPFYYRFILYLLPSIIILIALGTSLIAKAISKNVHPSIAVLLVICCCYFYTEQSFQRIPRIDRTVKPVLDVINQKPGFKLYITTPYTLYEYYEQTGYVKNHNREPIGWNLSPQQYYETLKQKGQRGNYLLLFSTNGNADGYSAVLNDLKKRNLIVYQYDYGTYGILEAKSITE